MEFSVNDILGERESFVFRLKITQSFKRKKYVEIIENIDIDRIVTTISPNWLELKTLQDEFKYNDNYRNNIQSLTNKYCAWKKVRGDGNCYYRAVMSTYITKIFHFNQHENRIFQLIGLLESFSLCQMDSDYKDSIIAVLETIKELYLKSLKSIESKIEVFKEVCQLLQKIEFDRHLVATSRIISYITLNSEQGDSIKPFLTESELESINTRILTMNTEAEGVELSLCPLALKITVNQVNIFDKIIFNAFPVDLEGMVDNEVKPIVDIISKSRGHYDALYSIKDMEEDDYCLEKMQYCCDIE